MVTAAADMPSAANTRESEETLANPLAESCAPAVLNDDAHPRPVAPKLLHGQVTSVVSPRQCWTADAARSKISMSSRSHPKPKLAIPSTE